jgi:hypothetical protein
MARTRQNASLTARLAPALKALCLCTFVGGSGIGYVWQKDQVHQLGQVCRKLESRRDELRRANKIQADSLNTLCSPAHLKARVKQFNLELVEPDPTQVVRLVEYRFGSPETSPDRKLVLQAAPPYPHGLDGGSPTESVSKNLRSHH